MVDDFQKKLGITLKKMRKTCGFKQEEIGALFDIDQAGISRIESAGQKIHLDQLVILSKFYGVDLSSILNSSVNYWKLAERFSKKPRLPMRYQRDCSTFVRELFPFFSYISGYYGKPYLDEVLAYLGIEDIAKFPLEEKISSRCFFDILEYLLKDRKIFADDALSVVGTIEHLKAEDRTFSLYEKMSNSGEIALASVLNAQNHEGFFITKIVDHDLKSIKFSMSLNPSVRNLNYRSSGMDNFLEKYKKYYFEYFPTFFGFDQVKVKIEKSPFAAKAKPGLFITYIA